MKDESRNTILFVVLSLMIIFGYPHFFGSKEIAPIQNEIQKHIPLISQKLPEVAIQSEEKHEIKEIKISAQNLSGKILSQGILFNNILLNKYTEKSDSEGKIQVLKDKKDTFYAFSGWNSNESFSVPNEYTYWNTDDSLLSENHPVVFSWTNENCITFEKKIEIDNQYLITITDSVINNSQNNITLSPITLVKKAFSESSTQTAYEGPLGYLDGKIQEISYADISSKGEVKYHSQGGWSGITDKYWLVAFLSDKDDNSNIYFRHSLKDKINLVSVFSESETIELAKGERVDIKHKLFVGAKEVKTLDKYEEILGVKHFDLAIDFGYLYFLTKPLLYALVYIKDLVGNMGLSILILTLLIKLILWPLASKSYKSMNRMKDLQPKIDLLRKKYANDQMKLGQEITALYKKENVSPVGGCLPMFLQLPVLIALYKVLYISIEMRHAPFIGWISDLSMPDPFSVLNLGGLIPISLPGFLAIGIWPILMGLSMYLQQKMTPIQSMDPAQEKMMLLMPLIFTFMFAGLPAGLVIYWTFSNILAIIQQYLIQKSTSSKKLK